MNKSQHRFPPARPSSHQSNTQVVPGTFVFKRVMDAKFNSVIAGVIPLEVFSTKEFKANEARTPEEVLPFLHPALRLEKPEELLQEGVTAAGIAPAAEPDLVPPPPAAEEQLDANKATGEGKDPEMVPPEDFAESEEPVAATAGAPRAPLWRLRRHFLAGCAQLLAAAKHRYITRSSPQSLALCRLVLSTLRCGGCQGEGGQPVGGQRDGRRGDNLGRRLYCCGRSSRLRSHAPRERCGAQRSPASEVPHSRPHFFTFLRPGCRETCRTPACQQPPQSP